MPRLSEILKGRERNLDEDIRKALMLAVRVREQGGIEKAYQVSSNYPELAAAWDRAHSMGGAEILSGKAAAFQAAKQIALGLVPCDSQSADPRGVEMCKAAGILCGDERRKLEQSGHAERLAKCEASGGYDPLFENQVPDGSRSELKTPENDPRYLTEDRRAK
jgi:hypothetical protein